MRDCLSGSQNRHEGSAVYGYGLRWGRAPSMCIFTRDPEDIAARNWYDCHLLEPINRWESICFNSYCTLIISPFASPTSSVHSMSPTLAIAIPLFRPFPSPAVKWNRIYSGARILCCGGCEILKAMDNCCASSITLFYYGVVDAGSFGGLVWTETIVIVPHYLPPDRNCLVDFLTRLWIVIGLFVLFCWEILI